jgi:hypothetical protein
MDREVLDLSPCYRHQKDQFVGRQALKAERKYSWIWDTEERHLRRLRLKIVSADTL